MTPVLSLTWLCPMEPDKPLHLMTASEDIHRDIPTIIPQHHDIAMDRIVTETGIQGGAGVWQLSMGKTRESLVVYFRQDGQP